MVLLDTSASLSDTRPMIGMNDRHEILSSPDKLELLPRSDAQAKAKEFL